MKGCGRNYLCLDKIIEKYPFLLRSVRNTLLVLFKVRVMLTTGRAGKGLLSQSLVPLVLGRYERSCYGGLRFIPSSTAFNGSG